MIHVHAWHSLRQNFPIRKSEWVLASMTVGLAVLLSIRPELFESNEDYVGMARWASQETWQWLCFFIGFGRVVGLLVNGAYWRTPHTRALFAFANAFIWYRIAIGVAESFGIGMVVFPGLVVLDLFNFKQAAVEAGVSEGLRDAERGRKPTPVN